MEDCAIVSPLASSIAFNFMSIRLIVIKPCCQKGYYTAIKVQKMLESNQIDSFVQLRSQTSGFRDFRRILEMRGMDEAYIKSSKRPVLIVDGYDLAFYTDDIEMNINRYCGDILNAIKIKR